MWSNISTFAKSCPTPEQTNPETKFDVDNEQHPKAWKEEGQGSPLMRYKHAVCSTSTGFIYIHGGRYGNLPLDDEVWRFDPHQNNWLQLKTTGSRPPSLQEHTLVEFQESLYLFGGQLSASNTENSFWRLHLTSQIDHNGAQIDGHWESLSVKNSKFGAYLGPKNRRGHSAIVYNNSMYIFGGFEDFRGSSAQLWEYDLLQRRWELRNLSSTSACHPEARHSHSAIVHQDLMYIYGGLSDLKPLADLWCWSWKEKRWFKLKTRGASPGQLHGHTAIEAFGSMFVFGGERNGRTSRGLWRLNLSNLSWQKIKSKGPRPMPTIWHAAIANPLGILDEANYIVEGGVDDPKLFLKSCADVADGHEQEQQTELPASPVKLPASQNGNSAPPTMKHSHSIGVAEAATSGGASASEKAAPAHHPYRRKKAHRLSFLKRRARPKSSSKYELKQMHVSASANDFSLTTKTTTAFQTATAERHSIAIAPGASSPLPPRPRVKTEPEAGAGVQARQADADKIFDNLQTDIKQMFDEMDGEPISMDIEMEMEDEEALSKLAANLPASSSQLSSSRATYRTAVQTQNSSSTLNDINGFNHIPSSQRTSYAYRTPPSEANTLRESPSPPNSKISRQDSKADNFRQALLNSSKAFESGYDKRNNRPKSDIVRSLIDRADASIKHLYTPYFNQSSSSTSENKNNNNENAAHRQTNKLARNHQQRRPSASHRLSLDRSQKRHTIHQTTTFYNLYFSEEKSSSSATTSDNNSNDANQPPGVSQESQQETGSQARARMVRDDYSSDTIKGGTGSQLECRYTSGNLIGVRGASGSSSRADQEQSQLSLDTVTSDSKTLCNELLSTPTPQESVNLNLSSLPSALTGSSRRAANLEAATAASDNTSLSFSVIAEFEEDDMLQYSSPTEPVLNNHQQNNFANRILDDQELDEQAKQQQLPAHKSASSGYDSISAGYEQANRSRVAETNLNYHQGSDSSVRTDSSLGGFTEPPETSPEQSNNRARRALLYKKNDLSSTTTDSLVMTSEANSEQLSPTTIAFETTPADRPPTKSLPSSPPSSRQWLQANTAITQRKLPLLTRLTGKQRSKNRYWQLCMFVIGGKQGGSHGPNEPITIWRLYI